MANSNIKSFRNTILLFITAIIWGTAFAAQSAGMKYIGPFTFSSIRFFIGGVFLIPVIYFLRKNNDKKDIPNGDIKRAIKYGIGCGLILFVANNSQQMAMLRASAGKAGFITALYIIIVPILGIFLKKKTSWVIWISVMLALVGLYFLCIGRGNSYVFEVSDIQLLICSIVFSFHILYVDNANERNVDGVVMSCTQFFVASIASMFFVYPMDAMHYHMAPTLDLISQAAPALCYSGIMACGVAYTLQIVGQKDVNPTIASLILSLESVISAISGFLILGQKLSNDEVIGCVIMFVAIILAEVSPKSNK